MYKICVYIPQDNLESVKQSLFDAGAGKIGNYDCCCWQTKGEGQFRPLAGSSPHIGSENRIETVTEYKVELVCDDDCLQQAIIAMKQAHPYEEPAYDVFRMEDI